MVDLARVLGPVASARSAYPAALGLAPGGYALATVHRQANTEQPALGRLVEGLERVEGPRRPAAAPAHPQGARRARAAGRLERAVHVLPPLGYLDFTALLRAARVCLTDSGGVQKEAYLHSVPCVTLRDTTEWVETVRARLERPRGRRPGGDRGGRGRRPAAGRPIPTSTATATLPSRMARS